MFFFVYGGRDLASGEPSGISNPFVEFHISGSKTKSKIVRNTLNPNFFDIVECDIELKRSPYSPDPVVIILMKHQRETNGKLTEKSTLLGRY